jgi:hypothetical protein
VTPDERFAQWVGWIERIKNAVHALFLYRHMFRRLGEVTQAASLPPSVFFEALARWYASHQAIAVRRQIDMTRGTISLRRLLHDIATHPGVMSRDRHVALWDETDPYFVAEANANFDRFAGAGLPRIDAAAVRDDIARLDAAAEAIERHTNEAIAHSAQNPSGQVPTWGELHAAIDVIGEVVEKYYSLLTASMVWNMLPEIQDDWLAPFRQPWISEGE